MKGRPLHLSFAFILVAVLSLLATTTPAYGQGGSTTSSLLGTIADTSGAVVPGAAIVVKNAATAAQVEATIRNPASTAAERLEAAKIWWTKLKALSPYDGLNQNEDGSFVRLREVGATWTAPSGLAAKLGAREATFTLTGRNLFMKTNYTGVDPETNAIGRDTGGGTDGNYLEAVDAFGWPLARRIAFAIRLGY